MSGESCKCKWSWPIVFILHGSNGCIRKSKIIFQDWYLWLLNLSSVPFVLQVVFFSGKSRWSGLRRGGFLVVEGGDCYWSAAARPCGALLPTLLPHVVCLQISAPTWDHVHMSDIQSNAVVWSYGPVVYDVTSIICTRYKKRNNVQPCTSILPDWYSGRNVRDVCRAQGILLFLCFNGSSG